MVGVAEPFFQALQVLLTIVGFGFLGLQIREQERIARCSLINDLSIELNGFISLFERLIASEADPEVCAREEFTFSELVPLLAFFEKIAVFEHEGFIKISEIDLLYRQRFLAITRNKQIREKFLQNPIYKPYLVLFFRLERKWAKYIRGHKRKL